MVALQERYFTLTQWGALHYARSLGASHCKARFDGTSCYVELYDVAEYLIDNKETHTIAETLRSVVETTYRILCGEPLREKLSITLDLQRLIAYPTETLLLQPNEPDGLPI